MIANQQRSSRRRLALYERLAFDASAGVAQEPPFSGREATLVHEALDRLGPRDRRCCWRRGPAGPRRQPTAHHDTSVREGASMNTTERFEGADGIIGELTVT